MELSRHWRVMVAAVIAIGLAAVLVLGVTDRGGSDSVSAARPRATQAQELAAELAANDVALRGAIDAWRAEGDPPESPPPEEVMAAAGYLQDAVRSLARRKDLARSTIAMLPSALASDVRMLTGAARDLRELSADWPSHKVKTGRPRPLGELIGYYDGAFERYRIGQHYLAAVHHVESKFGRVKNDSVAGAQGPMQFIPSTWEIYGAGGDIQDPHDAIFAAARLLDANGAPGDYGRALYAYNPSRLYVDAVQRYARVIKGDPYAIYTLYCWEP